MTVRSPFSGVERKCIRPSLRAVLKALILLHFQRVLFLHISPVFLCPGPLAPFCPFCGTDRAVEGVLLGRGKWSPTFPAAPLSDGGLREQRGAQANVQGKDGGAEPFTNQRICNALRTNTFLAVVQEQAVPAIVVAALMYQPPGCAVLLVGHVRDFRRCHFTPSSGKILKASDFRF